MVVFEIAAVLLAEVDELPLQVSIGDDVQASDAKLTLCFLVKESTFLAKEVVESLMDCFGL